MPAFNEQGTIARVCRGLMSTLESRGEPYEVLVVDDGSSDETGSIARGEGVTVITHLSNKGYGASLKAAARRSRYSVLVTFDSDGQHDPADVLRLIEELEKYECDMVIGARGKDSPVSWRRAPGKKILSVVSNYLAGEKIPDLNSGLRAVRSSAFFDFIHILPNTFSLSTTLTLALLKEGFNVCYIPIVIKERGGGKSQVSILKDGYKTILLLINTIVLFNPNKVFLPASFILFVMGSIYAMYTIAVAFHVASGALLLLITSMIIFFFGIVADQLSAIRRERR